MISRSSKAMSHARRAGIVVLVLLIAACAKPTTTIAPGGAMDVLGPVPALVPNPVPGDWITQGSPAPGQLTVVDRGGVPALKVINGQASFITVKPAQASLLATPYLSWAWYMEPQEDGPHPVRLLVGFRRGDPRAQSKGELPSHDRALTIIWGESALQRGSIAQPKSAKGLQPAARYTARGGHENAGSWLFETVDLSDIYRRAWPQDDAGRVQITFIGIAAAPGKAPTTGYFSGLRLSR
jgi:hypothetical protein